jgi:signal transduction histidine kinase
VATALERVLAKEPQVTARPEPAGARGRLALVPVALTLVALAWWGFEGGAATRRLALLSAILVAWVAAGWVLTRRRPQEPLGAWLLVLAAGAAAGAATASASGAVADLVTRVVIGVLPFAGMHVLMTVPDGTFAARSHRTTVLAGYATGAVVGLLLWLARPDLPWWPIALEVVLAGLIGGPLANGRYRKATVRERQRMQWFGCALAVAAEVAVVVTATRILVSWPEHIVPTIAVATLLLPAALVAAASGRWVGRADRALTYCVSLAGLSGVVVAVYLVIVLGLGRAPTDNERTLLVLSMVAAGVAAALCMPARERLERFANRFVYGERHAPDEVLRTFGSRLSRAVPLDELLLQMVESLRKTLALQAAEVWTGSNGLLERTVSVPEQGAGRLTLNESEEQIVGRAGVSGPAWLEVWLPSLLPETPDPIMRVAPITNSGELLGLIVARRGHGSENFNDEDDRMLTELARQVGLALHNVQLDSALQASLDEVRRQASELQASRARIVAASDQARRQIERNLHDGAQQHLVALAVNVRLARQFADADPEQAKVILDELGTGLQEAVQELRELAHGIYPPLLMDQGLTAALRAAASRSPLDVEVVGAEQLTRYAPEVEAAVYFCCLEGLQNAAKYAGDEAHVEVKVHEDEGKLVFEVADDGAGFDPKARGIGAGFTNMNDRLGAIGGSLRIDAAPGDGTRVSGAIPLT